MAKKKYRRVVAPPGRAGRPVIDLEKCSACGRCISICPLGALEMPARGAEHGAGGKDKSPAPVFCMRMGEKMEVSCFACRDCEAVCPEDAIKVEGTVVIEDGFYRSMFPDRELRPPEPLGPGRDYPEVEDQLTEVEKVIYRRRSNRIFKKDPVPRELIERVLEAGRYAPSAGNGQPVRYVVITDPELIQQIEDSCTPLLDRLSKFYREGPAPVKALLSLWGLMNPQDMDIRPIYAINALTRQGSKLALMHHAPCVILVLADTRAISDYSLDCGIAGQNMVLTAHSLGLGTCYVGLIKKPVNMNRKLKKKLGIEYPYTLVTSIAMGFPKVSQDRHVTRDKTPITWLEKGR